MNRSIILDLFDFIKQTKKYWLLLIVILIILVGLLIVFGESCAVSPYIYSFF